MSNSVEDILAQINFGISLVIRDEIEAYGSNFGSVIVVFAEHLLQHDGCDKRHLDLLLQLVDTNSVHNLLVKQNHGVSMSGQKRLWHTTIVINRDEFQKLDVKSSAVQNSLSAVKLCAVNNNNSAFIHQQHLLPFVIKDIPFKNLENK